MLNTELATPITVAYGDGIGSEIMEATLLILREAGANISVETIEVGERIYNMGAQYGILPSAWEVLRRNKILLKSPIIVPNNPDYDYKNLNDIIYKKFDLSADTLTISNIIPHDIIEDSGWLAASSNINENFAMFESLHDSAPEIVGKNIANPSAIIQAAILMLEHIGQIKTAELIKNAWLQTLTDGIHTQDIYRKHISKEKMGTHEFAEAIIERFRLY